MQPPSTSSRTPELSDVPFSLGFEGEHFNTDVEALLIPYKDGEWIAVYQFESDGRYTVIWGNDFKQFSGNATLELIAYIHKLRGYL